MSKKGNLLSTEELDALLGKDSPADGSEDMDRKLELILNFPLDISVRIGETQMTLDEVLGLSTGIVIDLNKLLHENVDLLVNGKPFAKGDVVAMGEYFGIRITSIIKPIERVERLR